MWEVDFIPKVIKDEAERVKENGNVLKIDRDKIKALERYWFENLEKEYDVEDRVLEQYDDIVYTRFICALDFTFGDLELRLRLQNMHEQTLRLLEEGRKRQEKILENIESLQALETIDDYFQINN